jgi:hypothetical protein
MNEYLFHYQIEILLCTLNDPIVSSPSPSIMFTFEPRAVIVFEHTFQSHVNTCNFGISYCNHT